MNENHPEYPDRAPRPARESTSGPVEPGQGPPFRRLRTGRRRGEPTAPLDDRSAHEPAAAGRPETERRAAPPARRAAADAPADEDAHADVRPEYDSEANDVEVQDDPLNDGFLPTGGAKPSIRKRRRRRRNIAMLIVLGVFAVLVTAMVLFLQSLLGPGEPEDFAGPGEGDVNFTVEQGWGPLQIGRELEEEGIVSSRQRFLEAIQEVDAAEKEIHPGEYALKFKMPALDAATIMVGTAGEKVHYVAIKQNVRTDAVFEEINRATGIPIEDLEGLNRQPKEFGLADPVATLEGYLHPGEYRFPLETDAKGILQLMVDATVGELEAQGVTDAEEQYRVLKIASILQAEARPDDYRTVAGALENRLAPDNRETGGLLQVDSAVIYGLGRYSLQFTTAEKEDRDNEYNTYVHPGLPPTPIGSPANSAIEASVDPEDNKFYYWVTVDTTTGETKFAETYAEHRKNQAEFRTWCSANPDICK